jgi:hypothetical protein
MSVFTETLFLQATSIAISEDEIIDIIGKDELERIKKIDPHPYFECYSMAHEGISRPAAIFDNTSDDGDKEPITFSRKAIESIKDVIKKGIKFFGWHNKDNSTEGREELGQLVGHKQKEIEGTLHQLAVGYFPDKDKIKDYDICSQESIWDFMKVGGKIVADIAKDITAIALGKSSEGKPAFQGAKKLGFVQAFEENKNQDKTGDVKVMDYNEIKKHVDFAMIKQLVADKSIYPWQLSDLFPIEEIKKDKEFGKIFKEIEDFKLSKEEQEKKFKELEDEKKKLERAVEGNKAKDLLSDLMKEKKFTDNMSEKISKRYDKIKDNLQDLSKEGLSKFLDDEKEIFLEYSSNQESKDDITFNNGDGNDNLVDDKPDPLEFD